MRMSAPDSLPFLCSTEGKPPHILRLLHSVSACPRNCAESGIKDLGVVGIDGGWELYVGGNGGTHLRAGDLLMKVKTNEEVLEYAGAYPDSAQFRGQADTAILTL
jgi:NAD(P)H-nitrite reductase large subunit